MKTILSLFLLLSILYTKEIHPIETINASGIVTHFTEDSGYLYIGTDAGVVDILDLSSREIVRQIVFPLLPTAIGKPVPTRIQSIDRDNNKTLIVTSSTNGYRNVWIESHGKLTKIIDKEKHIMPKRAFFTKENKIIFGTFGSDVMLYDHGENYSVYTKHISESTMGGMTLSQDRKKIIVADESGVAKVIDVNSSKVEHIFSSEHLDNIYSVAYSNNTLVTGGQDRRVGVYFKNKKAYHIKSNFLVYCVGLSPSGKTGIYSSGFSNHLQLFDTASGEKHDVLVGHFAIPNTIMFIGEKAIISSGDEDKVFFWKLP